MNITKAIDPSIVTQENPLVDETALKNNNPYGHGYYFLKFERSTRCTGFT